MFDHAKAKQLNRTSRRSFLKTAAAAAVAGFPTIVPASVFGEDAPSNRINIGAIGVGRISRGHDMPGCWQYSSGPRTNRILAVADLYAPRVESAKTLLNGIYTKQTGQPYNGTIGYADYRELLANKNIDAVLISTPDHQHARICAAAVKAGKDVYMQKPASLTIAEGRAMVNHVQATRQIVQVGSQQRSWKQFARAVELVRNGRIGKVTHVEVGLPGDPAGGKREPMPVPAGFQYDAWLGSTMEVPYTLDRVMPLTGFDRPGWLRMEQFGAGMITGWGAHHVDTAHWGMDVEHTGPIEVWGNADFPDHGLWDVHGDFLTHALYANGMTMDISGKFTNGIKWIGTEGSLFVQRDTGTTPTASLTDKPVKIEPLIASNPKILDSVIGPNEWHAYTADDQHGNWLDCIRSRQPPTAPVELGHRACSTCLLHSIAMHNPNRHLHWDPAKESFPEYDPANSALSRPQRPPYVLA